MYEHSTSAQFIRSHDYSTRRHDDLLSQFARLRLTQNSISVVGPNTWSSIPEFIRNSPSRNLFKLSYKKFLLSFYCNDHNWLTHLFQNNCSCLTFDVHIVHFRKRLFIKTRNLFWLNTWHSRSPTLTRCKPISWCLFALQIAFFANILGLILADSLFHYIKLDHVYYITLCNHQYQ